MSEITDKNKVKYYFQRDLSKQEIDVALLTYEKALEQFQNMCNYCTEQISLLSTLKNKTNVEDKKGGRINDFIR